MRDGSILSLSRRRGMIDWMRKVIIFLLKAKKRNRNAKEGDAQLFGESLLGFRGTFSQAGKPCSVSEEHFPKRENLARFPRNISPGGKTLLGFRGTFPRAGKPCSVSEEHFPGREKLARLARNIFPGGKTLLGFRGTFSRAGKPCSAREEHFPGRENLARLARNIFPGGETLPGSWGTLLDDSTEKVEFR